MRRNYLLCDSIISPIGFGTSENLKAIRNGDSAIKFHHNSRFFEKGYFAGLIPDDQIDEHFEKLSNPRGYTRLEKLLILAVKQVLDKNKDLDLGNTGLIISTTKGNIDLLDIKDFPRERLYLWKMANIVGDFFGFKMSPVIVSNACISGALAIKTAGDLINSGRFSNAIVAGGDLVTDFVLSGFQSFQAISPQPCRPFSTNRQGISLGEAVAAVLISQEAPQHKESISILDTVTANDANHISGPSRTGEGLFLSLSRLLQRNEVDPTKIDYLSAHGTATLYNDEMESIAFTRAGLEQVPINSFKGYYGHTLGASALVETLLTKHSMLHNELFASHNFTNPGVSKPLNIIVKSRKDDLKLCLKTASGFGGCNLAMLLKKENHE